MARVTIAKLEAKIEELAGDLGVANGRIQKQILELRTMERERDQARAAVQAMIDAMGGAKDDSPSVQ